MDNYEDESTDGGPTMAEDNSMEDRVNELETAQATQAATLAGAQATQSAGMAGMSSTMGAMQAGTMATMVAGAGGFIVGIFLGMAISRNRR